MIKSSEITDRDILTALVNAVLSLGEKVTGEKMILTVWDKDGNFYNIDASGVKWVNKS